MKIGLSQDMIGCPVLFIIVKGKATCPIHFIFLWALTRSKDQRDHTQKTFNKYQISLTNTKYCLPYTGYHVLLKRTFLTGVEQHFIYLFYQGVYTARGDYPCLLAGDPVMKRWLSQDMIGRPVLFIIVKGRATSYLARGISCLAGGIFICCPFMLHIPHTFHNPLSPNTETTNSRQFSISTSDIRSGKSHQLTMGLIAEVVWAAICNSILKREVTNWWVGGQL